MTVTRTKPGDMIVTSNSDHKNNLVYYVVIQ